MNTGIQKVDFQGLKAKSFYPMSTGTEIVPSYPNCVSNLNAYYFGSYYAIKTQICVRLDFKLV